MKPVINLHLSVGILSANFLVEFQLRLSQDFFLAKLAEQHLLLCCVDFISRVSASNGGTFNRRPFDRDCQKFLARHVLIQNVVVSAEMNNLEVN
jgi:hypothetical protein